MTAINALERVVINRLDAEFQRHKRSAGNLIDHFDFFRVNTIRARADGETDNIRMVDRFGVELPEVFGFRVSIRERLEIDDEFVRIESLSDVWDAFTDLVTDRVRLDRRGRTEGVVVAVGASAHCNGSVAVRACESRVDDDLVDALTELFLEPPVVGSESRLSC